MKNIIIIVIIVVVLLLLGDIIREFNLSKLKILSVLISLIMSFCYIKRNKIIYYLSTLLFNKSSRIDLKDINTMDDFLKKKFKSKKRCDFKKIIRDTNKLKIIPGNFKISYINYLLNFLIDKYKNYKKVIFYMTCSILLFIFADINYFEYYNQNNKFVGWSSYFVSNNVYYDFIASPNEIKISNIGINALNFCFKNNINILDCGPTHIELKCRKFNAKPFYIDNIFNFLIN